MCDGVSGIVKSGARRHLACQVVDSAWRDQPGMDESLGEVGGQHRSAPHGEKFVVFVDPRELQDYGRIEPALLGFAEEYLQRLFVTKGATIGAIGGQRIVNVRDLQEPGFQRDSISAKAVWIPAAIHFFMMMANDGENGAKRLEGRADFFADDGMLAHDLCFHSVQRAGLKKDTFRYGKFADVVKPAGDAEFLHIFLAKAKTFSQLLGVGHKKVRVAVAEVSLGIDAARQRKERGLSLLVHIGFEAQESLDPL